MNVEISRELEGEIPLLTESQLTFWNEINLALENTICDADDVDSENEEQINETMEKVSVIEENLLTIIDKLKSGRSARRKFLETYPKWIKLREDGTEKLREIARAIQTDRFNCNVSKLVGYCTSLSGGLLTLTSAVLIPFTFGLSTPLAITGGTMMAAGCSTAVGTSITESVLLNNKVKNAQEIIDEDKVHFQDMNVWMEHASKLSKALCEIMEIDIVKDISESVKDLVERGMKIKDDKSRMNNVKKTINSIISFLPSSIVQAVPVLVIGTIISVLATTFLLLLNTENRLVFDCASITIRSIFGILSLTDDVIGLAGFTRLFASSTAQAMNLATAVSLGAVAVLGVALDVAGIALTSVDIHNGSLSSEAEKIIQAADDLEEETKILRNIYENISEPVQENSE